ncbi:PREDICTED: uncharacterized protein LOC105316914 [Amphimedon queenslandica]|uniref:SH3 domain-containing protein n=1 Tax=Amphimedon queenslandica TaxID=400682 RepID=A0A1X7VWA6_AMPQE|nr:PREDICTED: uncharacterized protein LOC105316914 [Amphimedon queenslandica]|eukprot:XP_019849446.1 PREDICTED: uncharacterized protein LOC105316914 [Amphimedon queenslandica]
MAASPSPPLVLPPSNASIRNGSPLSLAPQASQGGGGGKCFRDMPQASSNETIKAYASLSVRISEMTTEFIQKLSAAQKAHSQQLSSICVAFRRKAQDIKKNWVHLEGTHFNVWNTLITLTEDDAKAYMDLSSSLLDSVSQELQSHTAKKKLLIKKVFQYRSAMTSRVEKTEADLQKLHKEYCDQWAKYGESMEKDTVKDNQILLSYNHHNNYVIEKSSFSSLHDVFYGTHVYSMLDEIQSMHKDLLDGYADNIAKLVEASQKKLDFNQAQLRQLSDAVSNISSSYDVAKFATDHSSTVHYPPPKPMFQLPENNSSKLPVLSDNLQLIDLTQAPLLHLLDELKKQEALLTAQREKLQTEYESELNLHQSYKTNPALGDAHDVEVEMTYMRNVIREKECEMKEVAGKLAVFKDLEEGGLGITGMHRAQANVPAEYESSGNKIGNPRRSSEIFVQGKEHEWTDFNKKFPVQCRYCNGFIQVSVRPGTVCKICRISVHTKCQLSVPYCSGEAPTPKSPKLPRMNLKKVYKKMKGGGGAAFAPVKENERSASPTESESTGIYCTIEEKYFGNQPAPPPREQSLDPKRRSQLPSAYHRESLFEPSGEWDPPTHCVALYDYEKFNPNDMPLSAGNVIELLNTASVDWWKGTIGSKKGYFPAQYVQVVSPGDHIYKAMYDYTPSSEGEMPLSEGQILVLSRDEDDGWVSAHSGMKEGLVPKNYIEHVAIVE